MKKEVVLVTGGAGFIGSHLCERLLAQGHEVIVLDNFDDFYDPRVKRANLAECLTNKRFTLVEGDIRDERLVGGLVGQDIDVIVHIAARAGVRPSIQQPLLYQDANVGGTTVLLQAAARRPDRKFIFASSSSVYGNNAKAPFAETDPVDHPISPYAATKRAGELLCHAFHDLYGMPVTCLRFFTVYGPRQRPDLAIHKFVRLTEAGEPIPMYGDGSMSRDYTYIDDIIEGVMNAIDRCRGFHIYNLGGASPVSLVDLIGLVGETTGRKVTVDYLALQPGDVERTFADLALARRELAFAPCTELRDGLRKFVQWYRETLSSQPGLSRGETKERAARLHSART